jgi:four helix bundle protein
MARKLEELRVYQMGTAFAVAVDALLERPAYRRNRKLHAQTSDANDSITANISEGFEQATDAQFARFLSYSKGSVAEVIDRLTTATRRGYISTKELEERKRAGEILCRALGALMRHLDTCDYKDRGRYKSRKRDNGGDREERTIGD